MTWIKHSETLGKVQFKGNAVYIQRIDAKKLGYDSIEITSTFAQIL